jgi:alcohol dehydrogenase/propanol-preferring alcohol dehydrogenase
VDPGKIPHAIAATYACSGITVFSAIKKVMPMAPTEPIVLVGAGGLGLNAIAVLKALKHENIVVVDIDATKRSVAAQAGATKTVDGSGEGVSQRIIEACGKQPLAVIDLVNGTASAKFAFDSLRKGGKLVQVGLFGGELNVPLPLVRPVPPLRRQPPKRLLPQNAPQLKKPAQLQLQRQHLLCVKSQFSTHVCQIKHTAMGSKPLVNH